jgi:AcrR family transcriptional regulator
MARTAGSSAEDTRGRIVAAASALFSTGTYAGTSLRDIAESIGISKAALYYHFPSKESLLAAIFAPTVQRFEGMVADVTQTDGSIDRLALIERLIEAQCQHFVLVHALSADASVRIVLRDRFHFDRTISDVTRALVGSGEVGAAGLTRARCAMGAIAWTIRVTAEERIKTTTHGKTPTRLELTDDEHDVIVSAAAAVLGVTWTTASR